jgi:hypothetical protein
MTSQVVSIVGVLESGIGGSRIRNSLFQESQKNMKQDDAGGFVSRIRQQTIAWSSRYPMFEVFERSERALLECMHELGFRPSAGPDYLALSELSEQLQGQLSERAAWARVYIDFWYGRGLGESWRTIVQREAGDVRYAIQAALQVYQSSGSDSSPAAVKLVRECSCSAEALNYLAELIHQKEGKAWAEHVAESIRA